MSATFNYTSHWTIRAGFFAALAASVLMIAISPAVSDSSVLATAAAIDIVITLPVVYYFLIRGSAVPSVTVVPVFIACVLAGAAVLPDEHRGFFNIVSMFGVPAVELTVLGYLGYRIFKTRRVYLDEGRSGSDLMETLRLAIVRELKPAFVARAAAFEIGIFAIAFFKWKAPEKVGFSYHSRSGSRMLLIVFLGVLVVETLVLHILLSLWSPVFALLMTAISVYFTFQVFAHMKAVRLRPIEITDSEIRLRCGILGDAVITRDQIVRVKTVSPASPRDGETFDLLPLGAMSLANMRIDLSEPVSVFGVYGVEKRVSNIRIAIDEPEQFIEALQARI